MTDSHTASATWNSHVLHRNSQKTRRKCLKCGTRASPTPSADFTRCCRTFMVEHITSLFLVSKASAEQDRGPRSVRRPGPPGATVSESRPLPRTPRPDLLLMGAISWGTTGRILGPPWSNISWIPWTAMKLYGERLSARPSKNRGRKWW